MFALRMCSFLSHSLAPQTITQRYLHEMHGHVGLNEWKEKKARELCLITATKRAHLIVLQREAFMEFDINCGLNQSTSRKFNGWRQANAQNMCFGFVNAPTIECDNMNKCLAKNLDILMRNEGDCAHRGAKWRNKRHKILCDSNNEFKFCRTIFFCSIPILRCAKCFIVAVFFLRRINSSVANTHFRFSAFFCSSQANCVR